MVQVEFGIVTSSYANHTLEFPGYLWPLATEILYLLPFSHPDQLTHASIMFIVGTLKMGAYHPNICGDSPHPPSSCCTLINQYSEGERH